MKMQYITAALLMLLLPINLHAEGLAPGFFPIHKTEPLLLHKQIDTALLRKLLLWDARHTEWRQPQAGEAPDERTPILILHLWADYCAPCREEFPFLRELAQVIEKAHGNQVRFIFLSETTSPDAMRVFLEQNKGRMPAGPLYLDTAESLANALSQGQMTSVPYPVTVVLDQQRIVRHAFVGRTTSRRTEFLTAIDRLLAVKHP